MSNSAKANCLSAERRWTFRRSPAFVAMTQRPPWHRALHTTLRLGTARWRRNPELFDSSTHLRVLEFANRFSFCPPDAFDRRPSSPTPPPPRQPLLSAFRSPPHLGRTTPGRLSWPAHRVFEKVNFQPRVLHLSCQPSPSFFMSFRKWPRPPYLLENTLDSHGTITPCLFYRGHTFCDGYKHPSVGPRAPFSLPPFPHTPSSPKSLFHARPPADRLGLLGTPALSLLSYKRLHASADYMFW